MPTIGKASSIGDIFSLAESSPQDINDGDDSPRPPSTAEGVVGSTISTKRQAKLIKDIEELHDDSVLVRWWKPVVGTAWLFFIFYQISMALDQHYSEEPLCPYSDRDYPDWYWYTCYAVFGGFLLILAVIFMKLVQMRPGNKRVPLLVAFNIVTMGTIATFLALVFELGGTCIDVLNVASPSAIWGEWMACGPLLFFITLTIVDKPNLTKADWFFMIMFFLCLITGFFIIPPQPYESGAFWLAVSCVTYVPVLVVPWYEAEYTGPPPNAVQRQEKERHFEIFAERYAKRYNLAMWLEIILPLYTVNYLIATWGGIDAPTTILIYQVLSVFTKGLFAAYTMDIHMDLLLEAEKALVEEKRANEARRAFMKYIFHEVRTPLNSLTMGIDLLTMSENLDDLDRESLSMMKAASEFMSDTLDDVLSMQKIEEGKLELEMTPFSFENSIKKVFATFRGAVTKKKIVLSHHISPNTPPRMVCDIHRIEHVISNLLSNAIKFSPEGKRIRVEVITNSITKAGAASLETKNSSGKIGHDVANVTVSIQDEGPGVSKENQALLFNNFVQIRPGALQSGQGSGLGLSFCKQIVELHGGTIGITSEEGQGSRFHFTIPYAVAHVDAPLVVEELNPIGLILESMTPQQSARTRSPSKTESTLGTAAAAAVDALQQQSTVDLNNVASKLKNQSEAGGGGDHPSDAQKQKHASPSPKPTVAIVEKKTTFSEKSTTDGEKSDFASFEVLVVDDTESNRKMLVMLLRRKGVASHTAENGQIAVDMVKADLHAYKLVLMDNLMPVMNGVDAAKAMREAGYPYLIAGITGNVMEDDIDEYLAAGADLVISKPLKRTTLDLLVKHIDDTGPLSRPGYRLLEQVEAFEWLPKKLQAP